jgi:hypothetical protein
MGTTPSRADRAVPLLWASLAITAGFLLFRLAGLPVPAIAALFACGLGVANLCPLSSALTLAAAPANGDTDNARAQLLAGALVIAAPTSRAASPATSDCTPHSPSCQCSSGYARSCSPPGSGSHSAHPPVQARKSAGS